MVTHAVAMQSLNAVAQCSRTTQHNTTEHNTTRQHDTVQGTTRNAIGTTLEISRRRGGGVDGFEEGKEGRKRWKWEKEVGEEIDMGRLPNPKHP